MTYIEKITGEAFPSPLGASYFQIYMKITTNTLEFMSFRPLSGHLISKFAVYSVLSMMSMVSVPSRGILFPNMYSRFIVDELGYVVSVPSRGILFPNWEGE